MLYLCFLILQMHNTEFCQYWISCTYHIYLSVLSQIFVCRKSSESYRTVIGHDIELEIFFMQEEVSTW